MIEHVYRRVADSKAVERVIIATDDARIATAVRAFGGELRLTRADHPSGTDRLAEVVANEACDLVVNVQGDEPLLDPRVIAQAIAPFLHDSALVAATLKTLIHDPRDLASPHIVKVVTDHEGFALYFSRAPIPAHTGPHYKHLGLYVYTRAFLLRFPTLPIGPLEQAERLEQLRILENGYRIKVVETPYDSISVDTPEDLARVEALLASSTQTG